MKTCGSCLTYSKLYKMDSVLVAQKLKVVDKMLPSGIYCSFRSEKDNKNRFINLNTVSCKSFSSAEKK
jgi:hypothetical protein